MDWTKAKCRGIDPDVFFPNGRGGRDTKTNKDVLEEEAAKICNSGCPIREDCLEYALNNRIVEGVFGGATERDRKRMLKRRARIAREVRSA